MDLVGTCPKWFWEEWLAEGDCAGEPDSGHQYEWQTRHAAIGQIDPGDRFYVVAHGRLRGYAIVTSVGVSFNDSDYGAIVREGGAIACTIDEPIKGFRGLRKRWWDRSQERPFPEWQIA